MQHTVLGRTGLRVSRIAFGAGPVSGLMTGNDVQLQSSVIEAALRIGINWFDTAAGYGNGRSEINLGRSLNEIDPDRHAHIATKVRVLRGTSASFGEQIEQGIAESLQRLGRDRVTLIQLHNGMTTNPDDEPFSVSVSEILARGGIADALAELKRKGMVQAIGLTGTGHPEAMRAVVQAGVFDTIQIPFNLLNPSAGRQMSDDFEDRNYGNVLEDCLRQNMGCFAIRVFAGGAVLGLPPSAHTLKTPFFPLDLYQRDAVESQKLRADRSVQEMAREAIRFSLEHPAIHSAIIGLGTPEEVRNSVV